MRIHRKSYSRLLDWKESAQRKPLLIRGARQVGKTTLVREFANEFANYIELNLEKEADRNLFEVDDINKILNSAFLLKGVVPDDGPTLVFIDEIQESPKAIQLLRYFYEERPDLHVIAAGSLLEFAISKVPSFPVGRIEYLYLHPLNFEEYLGAIDHTGAIDALNTIPVPDHAHNVLLNLFHEYTVIGGMPEVVAQYLEHKNVAMLSSSYQRLWQSFKEDAEKYARNETERKVIRHIIEAAPNETDRIKFEGFARSNYRSREVGEAFRSLDMARIIQLIYPTTSLSPPLIPDYRKRPRLQFLDTGLLNNILLLQGEMISMKDMSDLHRGKIIQHLVCQELVSIHETTNYKPNFWVREEKNNSAEVDMVYRSGSHLVPIEVKSGKQGRLRSLHEFVNRADHPFTTRFYAGNFTIEKAKTPNGTPYLLMNLPYYLGTKLPGYIDYLIQSKLSN